ncbi:hypothetical protein C0J52_01406 [Blattella germanica]|nr:hypothetical protein C0J52_01406 [Blattella germanica]
MCTTRRQKPLLKFPEHSEEFPEIRPYAVRSPLCILCKVRHGNLDDITHISYVLCNCSNKGH